MAVTPDSFELISTRPWSLSFSQRIRSLPSPCAWALEVSSLRESGA
jgi:hypothetical protein